MNTRLTPLQLEVLIWYHTRNEPFPNLRCEPQKEALNLFHNLGAIEPTEMGEAGFRTTPLGAAWLENILQTPVPVVRYVDPRFTEHQTEWKEVQV